MNDGAGDNATSPPHGPGARLRAARESAGLSIGDIAGRTRIPQRHLESIEGGAYAALPSTTYAVGFARAYARAVGIDDASIAADVRRELAVTAPERHVTIPVYEVEDPSRTPPRGIVWGGVIVALLLIVGVALWYGTDLFRGGAPAEPAVASEQAVVPVPAPAASPTPVAGGQVSLTATDEVWVRIYDAADTTLLLKTMAAGERYDVPPGANDPMINVGRPDQLRVTVNGSAVPPLGDGRVAIKDVKISAAALLARGAAGGTPAPTPTPTPTASGTVPPAFN
ncbi:helix-turn-helix domain-containing protein [Sphingomonas guangdongensis]|uniref:helix-turn-helix domain-containing protein n=1 Tax=Sphingomonas guangdongensis TaxID=1141890 RepID=UPI0015CEAF42|nr:helix-turn-helix domain-containing protein [Sphingomonas guangdongensis]